MSPSEHNASAVEIEDDPPHEIYASLVGSCRAGSGSASTASAANNTTARCSSHAPSFPNNNRYQNRAGAAVISTEDEDNPAATSNAQFMQFYHKSCAQLNHHNATISDHPRRQESDATKTSDKRKTRNEISHENRSKYSTQKPNIHQTTKAERKRLARRQREIEIARDRHISMMLRSDVSEEYASLYRQLHR